jgi:hypothetical protein
MWSPQAERLVLGWNVQWELNLAPCRRAYRGISVPISTAHSQA